MQVRKARAPCRRIADVAAHMTVEGPQAGAIAVRIGRRKSPATAGFGAKLDQEIGRRDPFHLHRIVVETPAEERLVRKRRVLEIPRVLVDAVLITDAGEEATALNSESFAQCER